MLLIQQLAESAVMQSDPGLGDGECDGRVGQGVGMKGRGGERVLVKLVTHLHFKQYTLFKTRSIA